MTRATLPGMVILALASPLPAGAADGPWNTAFTIQVGAFNADAHTTARLDATTINRGTEVSLEGDLGVQKTKTLPDIYGLWRFNDRHAIEAEWVSLRRDGTRSLTGQISWGDATFPINSTVNTTFDSDVVRVAYARVTHRCHAER